MLQVTHKSMGPPLLCSTCPEQTAPSTHISGQPFRLDILMVRYAAFGVIPITLWEPPSGCRILSLRRFFSADYLNQPGLNLTIFAPTNDAWIKRMPTLTTRNGITVQQLFSESNSAATQSLLQYHILNTPQRVLISPELFSQHEIDMLL